MIDQSIRRWQQYFHRISKHCGTLKLDGVELTVINVSEDEFEVRDVYGHRPSLRIERGDKRISSLQLYSAFS